MNTFILKIIFVLFMVGTYLIRSPHERRNKQNKIADDQKTPMEKLLLGVVSLGMMLLPTLYVLTPFLSFADYEPLLAINLVGIGVLLLSLWIFYRSHRDLGKNWSVSLEIREEHTLVTEGIYRKIRHPMYTAIWLWVIGQALILPNYLAGFSGIITFGLLYFLRVGKEEEMMIQQFGKAYEVYKNSTNRLIPKF
ncbi:MAG: protein-S-isoprenylcysteine O-methyltransferase [Bacteroidota bacterium]